MEKDALGVGQAAQSAEAFTKEARELVLLFLKPAVKELGVMMADAVRILRMKTVGLVLIKAKANLEAAKLTVNPIPAKVLMPIMEGCSLEVEDDMIELWANLLTSAACGDPVLPTYIRLLAELSPAEARLVSSLHNLQLERVEKALGAYGGGVELRTLRATLTVSQIEFRRIIINLIHLGLVCRTFAKFPFASSNFPKPLTDDDRIETTETAIDFLTVCSRKPPAANT